MRNDSRAWYRLGIVGSGVVLVIVVLLMTLSAPHSGLSSSERHALVDGQSVIGSFADVDGATSGRVSADDLQHDSRPRHANFLVSDEAGSRLRGATISAIDERVLGSQVVSLRDLAVTDGEGRATIDWVADTSKIVVGHSGHLPHELECHDAGDYSVVLRRGNNFAVQLITVDGSPVPGVRVLVSNGPLSDYVKLIDVAASWGSRTLSTNHEAYVACATSDHRGVAEFVGIPSGPLSTFVASTEYIPRGTSPSRPVAPRDALVTISLSEVYLLAARTPDDDIGGSVSFAYGADAQPMFGGPLLDLIVSDAKALMGPGLCQLYMKKPSAGEAAFLESSVRVKLVLRKRGPFECTLNPIRRSDLTQAPVLDLTAVPVIEMGSVSVDLVGFSNRSVPIGGLVTLQGVSENVKSVVYSDLKANTITTVVPGTYKCVPPFGSLMKLVSLPQEIKVVSGHRVTVPVEMKTDALVPVRIKVINRGGIEYGHGAMVIESLDSPSTVSTLVADKFSSQIYWLPPGKARIRVRLTMSGPEHSENFMVPPSVTEGKVIEITVTVL